METTIIDKLAFIYLKNGKILCTMSKGKDTWYIPGGKREEGESDEDALYREVEEELGVQLERDTIEYYGTFEAQAHGKPEGTIVRMTCYTGKFHGEIMPDNEIEKAEFLAYEDKKKEKLSPVDYLIFEDLYSKGLL
jgi:8-oxo-dGTP diphosphatase